MSGMYFNAVGYQLNEQTGTIDYEDMERKALEHRPKLIIGGASAYSREWDYKRMREIADKVGALLLIDMAHTAGLIAAGLLDNPVKYAHIVTSTTHKTLRGPRGGIILMGKDFDNPWGLHHAQRRRQEDVATAQLGRLPRHSGRPARTRDRRQGRRFRRSARTRIQGVPGAGAEECQGHGRSLRQTRLQNRFGRYGQPPDAGRPADEIPRIDGQAGRAMPLSRPTSPPTRIRYRSTAARRSRPRACVSVRPRSPRAA